MEYCCFYSDCPICNVFSPCVDVLLNLCAIAFIIWVLLALVRRVWWTIRDFNFADPGLIVEKKETPND